MVQPGSATAVWPPAFSRTAQGAGLAGVHYIGYMASGNNRIQMLLDSGLINDPNNNIQELIDLNASGKPGAAPDNFPSRVFQMIKVDYTSDLARVHLGASVTRASGTENIDIWTDLVWRDGKGWVVKAPAKGEKTYQLVADYSAEGWASWW